MIGPMYSAIQAKVDRKKEFNASLQRLRGKDADISNEATEIQVLTSTITIHST